MQGPGEGSQPSFALDIASVDNLGIVKGTIATKNLVPGRAVYGERLVRVDDSEFRLWNPKRSKLAAAIYNGLRTLPLTSSSRILYLGAATGTTASHISDIASAGRVYCIEFSPRAFRELLALCTLRKNMIPILADASQPESYLRFLERCDVIYQDIAQPNQVEIFIANVDLYLKDGGHAFIALKARSIDSAAEPKKIYREAVSKLERKMEILQALDLEPYEKDHMMVIGRWRA